MKSAPRITLTTVTLLVALATAACTPRVRPPVEPRADPALPPQINLTDRELQDRIAVSRPIITQDEAGLMFITLPVRNTSARQLTIEYRVTWFDKNRVPIHQTTWFPKILSGHTPDQFSINATTPRVDDFQIDIRPAK